MLQSVLQAYGLKNDSLEVRAFGSGLINNTWLVKTNDDDFILQRINTAIFKEPLHIAQNIEMISAYFSKNYPEYLFVVPVKTVAGDEFFYDIREGYFRMFPFVPGSHTMDVVQSDVQAYEAARQFGKFTRLLSGFDLSTLKITIPDFHNLTLRYQQFQQALTHGNAERIKESARAISEIKENVHIAEEFEKIKKNPDFKLRVIHHDTKISNILFDDNNRGLCVIDLDTVMPGYFISDLGDMLRTYLSPVSEEEKDYSKIEIRDEFFRSIIRGYAGEMKDELSGTEKKYFVYAGKFMIYMQALRFLTDYLNNDVYYGSAYTGHNFIRANNQLVLLAKLGEKESLFSHITL
ncbi:MAG: aminoglycoside phosphotransferase family protein [Ginsengibacter sp.]